MKKQLQQELIALAKRTVQMAESQEVSVGTLKTQARQLYEKLSILEFVEQSLATLQPQKERPQEIVEPKEKDQDTPKREVQQEVHQEDHSEHHTPDGTQYSQQEAITEPNTEKIKDIVAQMPPESDQIDQMLNTIFPKVEKKEVKQEDKENSIEPQKDTQQAEEEDEFGVHFDRLPLFEPVSVKQKDSERPKSLNDRLKGAIHIGLNDRHAFVKHLFGGSTSDYNRVLSQLNTQKSKEEALNFLENMVKPDYNNWEGKELYENRFLNIIENRFE